MALVPHKVVALNELNEGEKNTIAGAVVSLFDTEGNAVTLFDDESGTNGSTAKQTDSEGVVVVYVTPGEYDEQVNGGIQRRVLVGNKEITTEQLIERIRKAREGDVITTTGFSVAGDSGGAQWVATSITGLAPSQTPVARGTAELVDGSGRLWELVGDKSSLNVAVLGGGVNDDYLVLLATASATENNTVTVNIDMVASQDNQAAFADITFIGSGSIEGLYRKYVFNEEIKVDSPKLANIPSQITSLYNKSKPKVAIVGDSISTYAANFRNRNYALSNILEAKLSAEIGQVDFYNRAIGGETISGLDGVSSRGANGDVVWYDDPLKPWLDYVEELSVDLLFVSFGMNDSDNVKYAKLNSVVAKIKSWDKVPAIVFCTNLTPSLSGNPSDEFATREAQEGRDYVAGLIRSYAAKNNFGLIDFNRQELIVRDGIDPVSGVIGNSETVYPANNRSTGTRECYNFRAEITFNENLLIDDPSSFLDVYTDGYNRGKLRIRNAGGFYRVSVFSGDKNTTLETPDIYDTSEAVGTDTSVKYVVEVYSDYFVFYKFETSDLSETRPSILNEKFVRGGGLMTPNVLSDDSKLESVKFDYSMPFISKPSIDDRTLWGDNKDGLAIGIYEGSGWNHPSSYIANFVYLPVLSQFSFSPSAKVAASLGEFIGGSASIQFDSATPSGAPYGGSVLMPGDAPSAAVYKCNKSGVFSGMNVKYITSATGSGIVTQFAKGFDDQFLQLQNGTITLSNEPGVQNKNIPFISESDFNTGDLISVFRNTVNASDDYGDFKIISIDLY